MKPRPAALQLEWRLGRQLEDPVNQSTVLAEDENPVRTEHFVCFGAPLAKEPNSRAKSPRGFIYYTWTKVYEDRLMMLCKQVRHRGFTTQQQRPVSLFKTVCPKQQPDSDKTKLCALWCPNYSQTLPYWLTYTVQKSLVETLGAGYVSEFKIFRISEWWCGAYTVCYVTSPAGSPSAPRYHHTSPYLQQNVWIFTFSGINKGYYLNWYPMGAGTFNSFWHFHTAVKPKLAKQQNRNKKSENNRDTC
jgi:hypothetical protein